MAARFGEKRKARPADHLLRGVAEHLGATGIDVLSDAAGVDDPDPFLGGLDNAAEAGLASLDLGFERAALLLQLVQAMGLSGISKSQVSKLCKDIDERVNAFLDRPLDGEWPYLWLDATYLKVRDGGRIVSVAAIIAMAVSSDGRREIVGLGIGPSEAEPFWSGFLKSLVKRGLRGVKLVVSDAHEGLRHAITHVLGAAWVSAR